MTRNTNLWQERLLAAECAQKKPADRKPIDWPRNLNLLRLFVEGTSRGETLILVLRANELVQRLDATTKLNAHEVQEPANRHALDVELLRLLVIEGHGRDNISGSLAFGCIAHDQESRIGVDIAAAISFFVMLSNDDTTILTNQALESKKIRFAIAIKVNQARDCDWNLEARIPCR